MAEKKMLKVGIIGCGGIAVGKHMPGLAMIPEVQMTAFSDIMLEKAEKAAKDFGVEGSDVYNDYRLLLEDDSIDVVHVCTSNKSHAEITVAALKAGKHVMCEKPMAKNAADALLMLETARETGKKLTIGYQGRYRKDTRYLKKLCENGELGEIYFAKAHAVRRRAVPTWGVFLDEDQQGGGPLIDIGTHALDMTLWMMDNYKPLSVMGSVYRKLAGRENSANAWGPWDPKKYTVEDSAFGFIKMENGATIILESSWALNTLQIGEARTTLCGTVAGADMVEGLRINGEKYGELYVTKPDLEATGVDFYEGKKIKGSTYLEARHWIDSILYDKELVVKPEQAYVVTQILDAIYESAKTGKTVYFNK